MKCLKAKVERTRINSIKNQTQNKNQRYKRNYRNNIIIIICNREGGLKKFRPHKGAKHFLSKFIFLLAKPHTKILVP